MFRAHPFIFCYSQYAFYTIVFGYLFHAIEYEANQGEISSTVFTITNSMWCSFITMTTVGYGDFYPKTILGRFVGYFASFAGVALESVVILSVQNIMRYTIAENLSYMMITMLDMKEVLKRRAAEMLVASYRLKHAAEGKWLKFKRKKK